MHIFVKNLEFVGAHGVYEEERREGRRFQVDLSVDAGDIDATATDDLHDTLDYRGLAEIILEVGHGPSRFLIERLAEQIVEQVFARYTTVQSASVTIRKFATGVPGDPECVGVSLERTRT